MSIERQNNINVIKTVESNLQLKDIFFGSKIAINATKWN